MALLDDASHLFRMTNTFDQSKVLRRSQADDLAFAFSPIGFAC